MLDISRRTLLGGTLAAAGLAAAGPLAAAPTSTKPIVYWAPELSSEALLRMYSLINRNITGRVALKLHTGEPDGPNILPREWIRDFQAAVPNSTIVECNVLYKSPRQTTEGHRKVLEQTAGPSARSTSWTATGRTWYSPSRADCTSRK